MSKIALVDDDRNILTSVSMTLEAEGFEVETYNDGQAALDAFNKKLPDMAVLDIKMPRMDGMELLRRLRQKTEMPVIFLTSKDEEIDELFGLKMGADDYIAKPFPSAFWWNASKPSCAGHNSRVRPMPKPALRRARSWNAASWRWIRNATTACGTASRLR